MRKDEMCSEVGVRMPIEPKVLEVIIKGREAMPVFLREGIDLESKTELDAIITADNFYEEGRAIGMAIGRLLMDAITPRLKELKGAGNVVLTLVAKREE